MIVDHNNRTNERSWPCVLPYHRHRLVDYSILSAPCCFVRICIVIVDKMVHHTNSIHFFVLPIKKLSSSSFTLAVRKWLSSYSSYIVSVQSKRLCSSVDAVVVVVVVALALALSSSGQTGLKLGFGFFGFTTASAFFRYGLSKVRNHVRLRLAYTLLSKNAQSAC